MSVNNGKRVLLDLPDFFGLAGLVEAGEVTTLAYRPNRVARALEPGAVILVEEIERTVAKVEPSSYVDKMVLVTLF